VCLLVLRYLGPLISAMTAFVGFETGLIQVGELVLLGEGER
jgi:hypothetical protein